MNAMIDLETLGTGSKSAILSIGVVIFTEEEIVDTFYEPVDLDSCLKIGMEVDASTIVWWLKQSREAQGVFTEKNNDLFPSDINSVLIRLKDFLNAYFDSKIWGNGSDFDNVIIANAFKKVKLELPWDFWNNRCYRTVKNLYKDVKPDPFTDMVKHNALDDAKFQALHLIKIAKEKKLNLN